MIVNSATLVALQDATEFLGQPLEVLLFLTDGLWAARLCLISFVNRFLLPLLFWLLGALIQEVEALGAIHVYLTVASFTFLGLAVLNTRWPIPTGFAITPRLTLFKILVSQIFSPQFLGVLFDVLLGGIWVDESIPTLFFAISCTVIFVGIQRLPEVLVCLTLSSKLGHFLILLLLSHRFHVSVRHLRNFPLDKSRGLPGLFFLCKFVWFNYWRICQSRSRILRLGITILFQNLDLPTLRSFVRLQLDRWLGAQVVAISLFALRSHVTSYR